MNVAMPKTTRLFVASIIALVAVAFGFVIRAFLLNEWGVTYNLSETQKGSIQGAGLYPQALSIIFFSLVIDRLGYGRTIAFAFFGHVASASSRSRPPATLDCIWAHLFSRWRPARSRR